MTAKHTKGSLVVAPVTDHRHQFVALMAPEGTDRSGEKNVQVAMCSINHVPWDVAEANAARLALCWNMHDRLVSELHHSLGTLEREFSHLPKGTEEWKAIKGARALLAEIDGAK